MRLDRVSANKFYSGLQRPITDFSYFLAGYLDVTGSPSVEAHDKAGTLSLC